jgi:hypothetical protein
MLAAERHGVWCGLTTRERRTLIAQLYRLGILERVGVRIKLHSETRLKMFAAVASRDYERALALTVDDLAAAEAPSR